MLTTRFTITCIAVVGEAMVRALQQLQAMHILPCLRARGAA